MKSIKKSLRFFCVTGLFMLSLILVFNYSKIFAQEHCRVLYSLQSQHLQCLSFLRIDTLPTVPEFNSLRRNESTLRIPQRTHATERDLRAILDTIEQLLLFGSSSNPADLFRNQAANLNARQVRWNRAFEIIESIAVLADSSNFINAYYRFGRGLIYQSKAWSGLFLRDSAVFFAKKAVADYEAYLETGVVISYSVYESLAMLYFDFLRSPNTALRYLDRSLVKNPNRIYTYITRAQILRNIGRINDACQTLQRARTIEASQIIEMMIVSYGCR